jgi:hypothetical protein
MSRRFGFGLVWLLVTLLIAGGAAAFAYHLGTLATVTAASDGAYLVHPYAYGFFPFFGLFPLIVFVLFILLVARLFRPRRWGGGWYGRGGPQGHHGQGPRDWQGGLPPMFEEWHRRAHGETAPEPATPAKAGDEPPQRA